MTNIIVLIGLVFIVGYVFGYIQFSDKGKLLLQELWDKVLSIFNTNKED